MKFRIKVSFSDNGIIGDKFENGFEVGPLDLFFDIKKLTPIVEELLQREYVKFLRRKNTVGETAANLGTTVTEITDKEVQSSEQPEGQFVEELPNRDGDELMTIAEVAKEIGFTTAYLHQKGKKIHDDVLLVDMKAGTFRFLKDKRDGMRKKQWLIPRDDFLEGKSNGQ